MKNLKKFIRNTEAATAIEYGLIAALIAIAAIGAMGLVGTGVDSAFSRVSGALDTANSK